MKISVAVYLFEYINHFPTIKSCPLGILFFPMTKIANNNQKAILFRLYLLIIECEDKRKSSFDIFEP